jgi:hypothetical protein
MASLMSMPPIVISQTDLAEFGRIWNDNSGSLKRTPPYSSSDLGKLFDVSVGTALANLLGNIPVITPNSRSLTPSLPDCVEVGPVRVIGGVRPQNFDVGYRPDGVRFAFDSKTLNDRKSIAKNWQNMVNDLATEATTVHSRFPHAVVAFMVICPLPALSQMPSQQKALIETLERLARRTNVDGPDYMAEAISLVAWDPDNGTISSDVPSENSALRLEKFSLSVESAYVLRYKGLPPHTIAEDSDTATTEDNVDNTQ